jgi:UDP:flavonoid glycosyltransferase YjiC (YdhE family)
MRVLFSSTRGSGHLQPLLPYARALVARNHEVVVAAPAEVSATLRDTGLTHAPFDHPGDEALAPIWARLRDASPDQGLLIALRDLFAGLNAKIALPKLQATIRDWRPHLVVRDSVEFAALVAAEEAGVPHARIAVHSVSFEEEFPAGVDGPIDILRELLGLPADQGASLRNEAVFSSFPASLDAVPNGSRMRAPFRARVVEEAASSAPVAWAPASDPRPLVYITFGSIVGTMAHARSIYRTSLDAVADLPVRALLTTGRGLEASALGPSPANVHVEAWIPQRDVMPRAAALVCHGGSGTLLGGLAAGLPMAVLPLGADQPNNGRLVTAAGAGLNLDKPDASTLRDAIETLLEVPEFRRCARRIADEIAAMPTIDNAVDLLPGMASSSG